jgi:hypothetical protein
MIPATQEAEADREFEASVNKVSENLPQKKKIGMKG